MVLSFVRLLHHGEAFFLKSSLTRVYVRGDDDENKKIYFLYIFLFFSFLYFVYFTL